MALGMLAPDGRIVFAIGHFQSRQPRLGALEQCRMEAVWGSGTESPGRAAAKWSKERSE